MDYFNYFRRTLPPLVCVNSLGNIHAAGKHGDTTLSVSIPLTLSEFFLVSEEKMTRKYHMTTSEQQQQCYSRFWYEIIMGREPPGTLSCKASKYHVARALSYLYGVNFKQTRLTQSATVGQMG